MLAGSLLGRLIDRDLTTKAVEDYSRYYKKKKPSDWTEYAERDHMLAAGFALFAENFEAARSLMSTKRPLASQYDIFKILKRITYDPEGCAADKSFRAHCENFFEVLRNHDGPSALNTELHGQLLYGALLDHYVFRPRQTIDWKDLVARISR